MSKFKFSTHDVGDTDENGRPLSHQCGTCDSVLLNPPWRLGKWNGSPAWISKQRCSCGDSVESVWLID